MRAIWLIVLVLMVVWPVGAQDDTLECDVSPLITFVEALNEADDLLVALRELDNLVSQLRAECQGYVFSNETDGASPVLGPLLFPTGVWRITVETEGFFIAELQTLDGTCDVGFVETFMILSPGQATGGAQHIMESTDCEALFTLSNITADWTMRFEQLR